MLVMDAYTLAAIDLLHFFQQIDLTRLAALDAQNLFRILGALGQLIAGLDLRALLNAYAGIGGNINFPHIGLFTSNGGNYATVVLIFQEDFTTHAGRDT